MTSELIVYGIIFVAVVVLVEGVYLTVFGKDISLNRNVNRRLAMIEKGESRQEVLAKLRKEMNQHLAAKRLPLYAILADKAQKGGVAFTPTQLIILMVALTMMSFVLLTVGTATGVAVRAIISVAFGCGGVWFWVNGKAKKRMALIEEQLPDAVELMVRSLKVGHPFSSAVNIVAKEVNDPLASEMGVIADEVAYGKDMGDAFKVMADRLDLQDLRFLAVAVTIQQQSGGNLAEILAGLAAVIRSRFRLFRRVKAITAEAQWSGMFLSMFPLVALALILIFKPDYFDAVKEHPYFIYGCFTVAGFLVANLVVMKKLVNIKV
ncbi:tight adherence protein B [Hasllibacter halocynthiae]|uniref:Tight adherence protein B n=1 Tax=Hasllibacter halocynthiae TaxID=595589 RepID=A0A2T0X9M6_9RHOB|nr:type II secretion system F family protein [Hasllibacter halocynthiae]PRY95625.1 tight adherence protein B [Hasllibacter halocynthiae]